MPWTTGLFGREELADAGMAGAGISSSSYCVGTGGALSVMGGMGGSGAMSTGAAVMCGGGGGGGGVILVPAAAMGGGGGGGGACMVGGVRVGAGGRLVEECKWGVGGGK